MRAPHVVLPSLSWLVRPRHPWQMALLMFVPRHSWMRVLQSSVPPIPGSGVFAVCVICASGHAGWAAHAFHLCLCTRTQRFFFTAVA